jgi:hypothetical protein
MTSLCTPPPAWIHGTRTCTQLHSHVSALSSLPPLRRGVKLGLLRVGVSTPSAPIARSLPFGYGSTSDELAARTFKLQACRCGVG